MQGTHIEIKQIGGVHSDTHVEIKRIGGVGMGYTHREQQSRGESTAHQVGDTKLIGTHAE